MVVTIAITLQGFCGREQRDAECRFCALRTSCQATEKVTALWVPNTQRA